MKILKLLPAMLLLNCVVPSPEATAASNVALYLIDEVDSLKLTFDEFKEQISHGINEPLSDSELTDFKTNYFNRENIVPLETSNGILLEEYLQREDDSRDNIISLLEITKNWRVPSFYIQARTNFFADSIAKTILKYEVNLDAGQQNNVSRCCTLG